MRETFRLQPDQFPKTGTLWYTVRHTDDEQLILKEMVELAKKVANRPSKQEMLQVNDPGKES